MLSTRRAVVAAALLLSGSTAALAGDYIQRKDGSFSPPFKGGEPQTAADFDASESQILNADLTEVLYTIPVGGKPAPQKMPSADVLEIYLEPKDYPALWKEASNNLQSGEWANAAAKFRAIGDEKKFNPIVRQKALLRAARAAAGPGNAASLTAADGAYEYLLKSFPSSFYTRAVWRERWMMFSDANQAAKAEAAIGELLKLAGVTDADKLEARFALTSIKLRKAVADKDQPGIQKCLDEFKALRTETEGKKDLASVNNLAKIGIGNCMLELGSANDAKGVFEEMTQREGLENSVNAAAFNGLGECWFRQNDQKGFTEALRCFLRVQLIYADGASSDSVAKAMYYTGESFFRLGDPRAKGELMKCNAQFGSSPWGDKALKLARSIK